MSRALVGCIPVGNSMSNTVMEKAGMVAGGGRWKVDRISSL
ncbi:MAG: hypothetical protein WAX14_07295 [Rhodococcus sp. (in: high G+C Gram-positive bacteria)]